jgi:hypothetical protein
MAQTMLMDYKLTDIFWKQAMHTTVHIQNKVMLRNNIDKTDGRMGKFDSCVEKGILVGYSSTRKEYKCYNLRLNKVVESINVTIDETGRPESKEEENKSMEQLFEEENGK